MPRPRRRCDPASSCTPIGELRSIPRRSRGRGICSRRHNSVLWMPKVRISIRRTISCWCTRPSPVRISRISRGQSWWKLHKHLWRGHPLWQSHPLLIAERVAGPAHPDLVKDCSKLSWKNWRWGGMMPKQQWCTVVAMVKVYFKKPPSLSSWNHRENSTSQASRKVMHTRYNVWGNSSKITRQAKLKSHTKWRVWFSASKRSKKSAIRKERTVSLPLLPTKRKWKLSHETT